MNRTKNKYAVISKNKIELENTREKKFWNWNTFKGSLLTAMISLSIFFISDCKMKNNQKQEIAKTVYSIINDDVIYAKETFNVGKRKLQNYELKLDPFIYTHEYEPLELSNLNINFGRLDVETNNKLYEYLRLSSICAKTRDVFIKEGLVNKQRTISYYSKYLFFLEMTVQSGGSLLKYLQQEFNLEQLDTNEIYREINNELKDNIVSRYLSIDPGLILKDGGYTSGRYANSRYVKTKMSKQEFINYIEKNLKGSEKDQILYEFKNYYVQID